MRAKRFRFITALMLFTVLAPAMATAGSAHCGDGGRAVSSAGEVFCGRFSDAGGDGVCDTCLGQRFHCSGVYTEPVLTGGHHHGMRHQ